MPGQTAPKRGGRTFIDPNHTAMSNNDPIQTLMQEHRVISAAQRQITPLRGIWETDPAGYDKATRRLLGFFREYADQYHHYKEEAVLFRELRNHPDFRLDDILDELENHHEMFRETIREIESLLGDGGDRPRAQQLLEAYADDLLDHIAVEDDELFVTAASLFSPDELERLYFLFEDVDRELGVDRKKTLAENAGKI